MLLRLSLRWFVLPFVVIGMRLSGPGLYERFLYPYVLSHMDEEVAHWLSLAMAAAYGMSPYTLPHHRGRVGGTWDKYALPTPEEEAQQWRPLHRRDFAEWRRVNGYPPIPKPEDLVGHPPRPGAAAGED